MNIELPEKKQAKKSDITIPGCWVCMDKGFAFIKDSEGREMFHKCICKSGLQWDYNGKLCKKNQTKYYVPSINEFADPKSIAEYNFREWLSFYKNKPGVIDKLKDRGIPVEKLGA